MGKSDELACTYAALILADDKVTITVRKIHFLEASKILLQNILKQLIFS
jgi:hypothetical protein